MEFLILHNLRKNSEYGKSSILPFRLQRTATGI